MLEGSSPTGTSELVLFKDLNRRERRELPAELAKKIGKGTISVVGRR